MFLVKCSCGAEYTFKEEHLIRSIYGQTNTNRRCPGCGEMHDFGASTTLSQMHREDFEIYRMPNDKTILCQ